MGRSVAGSVDDDASDWVDIMIVLDSIDVVVPSGDGGEGCRARKAKPANTALTITRPIRYPWCFCFFLAANRLDKRFGAFSSLEASVSIHF
jgi:hypothetical protein